MSSIRLPRLRTQRGKYAAGSLCVLGAAVLYLVPNRVRLAPPIELPLTAIDLAVPFWPATGWLYVSLYLFLAWAFIRIHDLDHASRFLYACAFVQLTAAAVFFVLPTVYPRDLFPLPPGTDSLSQALVDLVRRIDTPANCLPSLHVSTTVLCVAALAGERRDPIGAPWLALALLLPLSTLTFKQHYLVDAIAGLLLGALGFFLFFRWRRIELAPATG